ncbi:uncharacterized protein LOC110816917 isoform X2 [Carica papaya]|uniref:uncharacterized protein LOC110816917 isoform X2 n=1 Tax=Carica papaya TaxID=3649 RepID=UPI000B8CAF11|nr:uncharacterized protein LOC110816917 isoform X2 [Carica papaya]
MEQSSSQKYFPYNSMETGNGNDEFHSASQALMLESISSMSMSMRPQNINVPEIKPVLNYSIQTGEEFSLEFMRDRVHIRKPSIPDAVGDPNYTPGCMELKGILGIDHRGSQSSSDISMPTTIEKGPKETNRHNSSLHDDRNKYGSVQVVPQSKPCYDRNQGTPHGYPPSRASKSLSTRMKVLCSFGGKALPRPSDGKLRYVGGETRIMRIRKNISWEELKQKTLAIYNQAHVIKYQLPGEDLDALVSVSSDEDIHNMMEECNELEDGEGPQKLRMFLFSVSDLDEADFGLGSSNGDSEIQYVVAVNGMDLRSSRNSILHGLESTSANNLDELDRKNIDAVGVARESIGVSASLLAGMMVSSSLVQSSQPVLPSSTSVDETYSEFFGHTMHHRDTKQFESSNHDSSTSLIDISMSMHLPGHVNQREVLTERQPYNGLKSDNQQVLVQALKPKPDITAGQQTNLERRQPLEKDNQLLLQECDDNMINRCPVEEVPVAINSAIEDLHLLAPRNEAKVMESLKASSSNDAATSVDVPRSGNDVHQLSSSNASGHGYAHPESNLIDLSYLEQHVLPQRVYYSERIPREQLELLNRLSKSNDSLGSQFLMSHSHSVIAQQEPAKESNEKSHVANLNIQPEPSSTAKPLYTNSPSIHDGFVQLQNYKDVTEAISRTSKRWEEHLNSEFEQVISGPVTGNDAANKDTMLKVKFEKNYPLEAGNEVPAVDHVASTSQPDIHPVKASVGVSTSEQGDIVINIDDHFPPDFFSDIFSKATVSDDSPAIRTLHQDGAGLSWNMENHEPKRWSYFQKLAKDGFGQKDVSFIDEHDGFSSPHPDVEGDCKLSQFTPIIREEVSFIGEDKNDLPARAGPGNNEMLSNLDHSHVKVTEHMQSDVTMENLRTLESEYEDLYSGKMIGNARISSGLYLLQLNPSREQTHNAISEGTREMRRAGLPPLDPSLGDFDIHTLQFIKNEDLEELRGLGSGTFGTVYHGKWRGTDVAIKRIKKSCFTGRSSEQERLTVEFWREADILSKLHHPNVVAFYGVVQDGPGGTLATVTEYMVDGSLRHVLLQKDRYLDRRKRLIIAMDAAFGMEYLHSKNIVHFDLKCDNLLVNLKDPSRPICKIKRNTLVSGGVRGTLPWMAPELLNGGSNKVSEKVDVFSFGIVLWEILTGDEPYANMHYGAIIGGIVNNTLRPTIPSFCDPEWRRLMEECWAPNPAARPSFTEIAGRLRVMSAAASQTKGHGYKTSK